MVTTYKKVGIDIAEIKKSQSAIGKIISSTHKTQKLAKVAHGFVHYAGIVQIPGNKFLATHTDGVGTKISKSDTWIWTLCWNSRDSREQILGYTYGWCWYKDYDC